MLDWTRTDNEHTSLYSTDIDQCGSMCKHCKEDIPLNVDEQGRYVEEVHVCAEG